MDDLAVIVVACNSAPYVAACLRSIFEHMGLLRADVIVVDAESRDDTADIVADFRGVRLIRCRNRGFAYANNRGLMTCEARYVLFLNPDTEILQGSLSDLVSRMDERLGVGLVGVRQTDTDGRAEMTIRHFPNAVRALGDALSAEHLPGRPRWLGERELRPGAYDREIECDWTVGSFMLARREAIESAGFMDERFFMYSEETDLCRRIRTAGWEIRHFPWMTILHYGAKAGIQPSVESLKAYSRLVYARKHFSPAHRVLYFGTVLLRHSLRAACARRGQLGRRRRAAHWAALRTLVRLSPPPHSPWSHVSVSPWEPSTSPSPVSAP
ncbi:MAG: glycosyltransferase family 2 protein [Actinomycetota bacterium]|nr:glycosyltransferase family 2 protein [Actinomycetota bacterium]